MNKSKEIINLINSAISENKKTISSKFEQLKKEHETLVSELSFDLQEDICDFINVMQYMNDAMKHIAKYGILEKVEEKLDELNYKTEDNGHTLIFNKKCQSPDYGEFNYIIKMKPSGNKKIYFDCSYDFINKSKFNTGEKLDNFVKLNSENEALKELIKYYKDVEQKIYNYISEECKKINQMEVSFMFIRIIPQKNSFYIKPSGPEILENLKVISSINGYKYGDNYKIAIPRNEAEDLLNNIKSSGLKAHIDVCWDAVSKKDSYITEKYDIFNGELDKTTVDYDIWKSIRIPHITLEDRKSKTKYAVVVNDGFMLGQSYKPLQMPKSIYDDKCIAFINMNTGNIKFNKEEYKGNEQIKRLVREIVTPAINKTSNLILKGNPVSEAIINDGSKDKIRFNNNMDNVSIPVKPNETITLVHDKSKNWDMITNTGKDVICKGSKCTFTIPEEAKDDASLYIREGKDTDSLDIKNPETTGWIKDMNIDYIKSKKTSDITFINPTQNKDNKEYTD